MIGWLIAVVIVYLLLRTKAGIRLRWESGTAILKLRIGFLRFSLSTGNKEKQMSKPKTRKQGSQSQSAGKTSTKKWFSALIHYWRDVLNLVVSVLKMPKLDLFRLHIAAGGKDPESCVMSYGRFCAALSAALPLIQQSFSVKVQDVNVSCQFDRTESDIFAEIETTVRVYEIFGLFGNGLKLFFRLYRHTKSLEKAVQA